MQNWSSKVTPINWRGGGNRFRRAEARLGALGVVIAERAAARASARASARGRQISGAGTEGMNRIWSRRSVQQPLRGWAHLNARTVANLLPVFPFKCPKKELSLSLARRAVK